MCDIVDAFDFEPRIDYAHESRDNEGAGDSFSRNGENINIATSNQLLDVLVSPNTPSAISRPHTIHPPS